MALFTDGPINGIQDMQDFENGILDVASIEGIDVTVKMALTQDQLGTQILFLLLRYPLRDFWWMTRRAKGVSDVVVTPELKRWHVLKSLAAVYADAFHSQLNDRYAARRAAYEELANEARRDYFAAGVGLVANPVGKPAVATVSAVPGLLAGAEYFVRVAWVNAAGQEGAPSESAPFTTTHGSQLTVAVTNPAANVTGWAVYVGTTTIAIARQNSAPLVLGQPWTLPPWGLVTGAAAGTGQGPERFVVDDRVLQRG